MFENISVKSEEEKKGKSDFDVCPEEGIKEEKGKEIAGKAISKGYSIEEIADLIGLLVEEIEKLTGEEKSLQSS